MAAGVGVMVSRVMARWSEMVRSVNERLWVVREGVEQTKSRMCPCVCVGEVTCWVKLRQFIMSKKSDVNLAVGESMWMLKSQRSSTDGEMEESWVTKSVKSEKIIDSF